MGGLVEDSYVPGLLNNLNLRFGPGDPIKEMAALQKEFDIFSSKHDLVSSFALLNIGPSTNWSLRRGWFKFVRSLKDMPSDQRGETGEQRIINVLRKNLVPGAALLPVYFSSHSSKKTSGVFVKNPDEPFAYSTVSYITISLPMTPIEKDRLKRRAQK